MKIKVNITIIENEKAPHLKALANLMLDGTFCVKGLRVLENSQKGTLFVQMPQEKTKVYNEGTKEYEDKYHDRFFPVTAGARAELTKCVLGQYEKDLEAAKTAEAAAVNAPEEKAEQQAAYQYLDMENEYFSEYEG